MTQKLEQAIKAVKTLSAEEQDTIATQMMTELAFRDHSALTAAQQETVVQRLNEPILLASTEAVATVLKKY